ncbi:MAG TPA: anti-sigma factor [Gemmatimonadales bacterium]|nr:anti-sigma factor [Gemmatimonadales bacterium]
MSHPAEPESPRDLAAAYALGALAPEEARRFEEFLAGSPETQREVAEYRDVAALLALGGGEAAPSADLRQRVLARVAESKVQPLRPARARGRAVLWLALAASLLAVVGLALNLRAAQGELRDLRELLNDTQGRLAAREATLNAIFEPGVQMYQLTASGDPEPGIQLFYDRQRERVVIHGFRLRQVPEDRAYQLWFIRDGKPVPSVTFKPEADGHARVEQIPVPTGGDVSAAAVTIEPAAGSTTPTMPIVLVGPLKRS